MCSMDKTPFCRYGGTLGMFILYLIFTFLSTNTEAQVVGNYSGDLYLGAFFPIHARGTVNDGQNIQVKCGQIQEQIGIQALEAFLFTLDKLHREGFFPGFKLGALLLDSCDDETVALEQTVELIRVLMTKSGDREDLPFICQDGSTPQPLPAALELHKIVGVVGASSSTVSIQLASLLKLFRIPQISYLSTSPDLSNTERYPYFARTVPSDSRQAIAILEILREFNWTYVNVLYDDNNYGIKGYGELEKFAVYYGICFAYSKKIEFDEIDWTDDSYDDIMREMEHKPNAHVVVMFVDQSRAVEIFEAAKRTNTTKDRIWIGSDAWSGKLGAVINYEDIAAGAITVQPLAYEMPGFDDYFTRLKPDKNTRDPWFQEFWEHHFDCQFPSPSPKTLTYDIQGLYGPMQVKLPVEMMGKKLCTGKEKIGNSSGYEQETHLHYIHDAVYAYAHAIRDMHRDLCGPDYIGLCEDLHPLNITGKTLRRYISEVNFISSAGYNFSFTHGVDGPERYTVRNFRFENGKYKWHTVGTYSGVKSEEKLDFDEKFLELIKGYPPSHCSEPCGIGQAAKTVPGERCCWVCTDCQDYEYVFKMPLGDSCVACEKGTWPNKWRNSCEEIPLEHISYSETEAIGLLIGSLIGMILTALVGILFFIYKNTPVIKASGRELSFYLLASIMVSYLASFAFLSKPDPVVCGFIRVFLGLSYTMVYASILTKTNRIARIFNENKGSPKKTRYTSPKSQLIIVNCLVAVEVLVIMAWMIVAPPKSIYIYPERDKHLYVCEGGQNYTYLVPLGYPLILLILCTVYAFKTRKTPDGFNETKLIGFTTYTTCVIWIAFMPLYFTNFDYAYRSITLSVASMLNASVVLVCIFSPKIYICLFRPQKNTREAVMTRSGSIISGSSFVPTHVETPNVEEKEKAPIPQEVRQLQERRVSESSGISMSPSGKERSGSKTTEIEYLSDDYQDYNGSLKKGPLYGSPQKEAYLDTGQPGKSPGSDSGFRDIIDENSPDSVAFVPSESQRSYLVSFSREVSVENDIPARRRHTYADDKTTPIPKARKKILKRSKSESTDNIITEDHNKNEEKNAYDNPALDVTKDIELQFDEDKKEDIR